MNKGMDKALAAALVMGVSASALAAEKPGVRPDVQAYLDALAAQPRPPMNEQTIAMIRKIPPEQIAAMMARSEKPMGTVAVDKKLSMPGPGGAMELS